jgi:hypothetical protein
MGGYWGLWLGLDLDKMVLNVTAAEWIRVSTLSLPAHQSDQEEWNKS